MIDEQKRINLLIEEDKIRREKVRMWKLSKRIGMFVVTLLVLLIFLRLATFFTPFLIALIIASIIEPFIKFNMKKFNMSRKLSCNIAILITIIVIIACSIWLATFAVDKINSIMQSIGPTFSKILTTISEEDNTISKNLSGIIPESMVDQVVDSVKDIISNFGSYVRNVLQKLLGMVMSVPTLIINTVITIFALILLTKDREYIYKSITYHFPRKWVSNVSKVKNEVLHTFTRYIKVYAKIILITTIELLIAFTILNLIGFKISSVISKSIIIALIDILPILGVGTFLLPWAVWNFVIGKIGFGIALLIVYLTILFIRQFIEPKLVSDELGIHPLITLVSMYVGFKFIGFSGLILGPFGLMVLRCVYAIPLKRGLFKDLFDEE